MNKTAITQQLLSALTAELASLTRAAQESFAAATDPDSKAENKYDTRNLEASYIARGQAQRVQELQEAVTVFTDLASTPRPARAAITLGAIVSVQSQQELVHYFIASHGGGTEISYEGADVCVLTPASALGSLLMGKTTGTHVAVRPGSSAKIVAVR